MASQKQIDANRANAQKSTGPTSPPGRARSRCNALRDGLTGQITTLSEQRPPFFRTLQSEMLADLNPQTPRTHPRQRYHRDTWRLKSPRAVESNLYSLGQSEQEAEKGNATGKQR